MKKIILIAAIVMIVISSVSNVAFAQAGASSIKYAVVDIETILKEMPEAIEADKKLKEIGTKWQDTLVTMKKDFDDKIQKYQKQKSLMNTDQQQKEEESLQKLQMQIMQYQEQKFGNTGELNIEREKFLEPIRLKIKEAIEKVAKDEKISLVLDKGNAALLYFEDKNDLTYKVLDVIKRGSTK